MDNNMHGEQENLPYPDPEELTENPALVKIIAPAYAGLESELSAILQYVYQHIIFENLGLDEYAEILLNISITEMKHMELLGSAILNLGALPIYTALPPCPVNFYSSRCVSRSHTPEKTILDDIAAERMAIAEYTKMRCELQDEKLAALIQRIRMDEELHLRTFERIFRELTEKN